MSRRIHKVRQERKGPKSPIQIRICFTLEKEDEDHHCLTVFISYMNTSFLKGVFEASSNLTLQSANRPEIRDYTLFLWGDLESKRDKPVYKYFSSQTYALRYIERMEIALKEWAIYMHRKYPKPEKKPKLFPIPERMKNVHILTL